MRTLRQFTLINFEPNTDNMKILCELYSTVLINDQWWHFLWEGKQTFIRVYDPISTTAYQGTNSQGSVQDVTTFLKMKKIKYTVMGSWWEDNIKITKRYQEAFTYLLHGFSVMALQLYMQEDRTGSEKAEDILMVMERLVHLFSNNMTVQGISVSNLTEALTKYSGPSLSEPMLMLTTLFMGSFVSGWRYLK